MQERHAVVHKVAIRLEPRSFIFLFFVVREISFVSIFSLRNLALATETEFGSECVVTGVFVKSKGIRRFLLTWCGPKLYV